MSAESKKISDTFVDQLDSFDDRLDASVDDVELLADIQKGIGSLLASSGSDEGEIRRVLLERYQTGSLRKETFELVNSMLDRRASEQDPGNGLHGESDASYATTSPSIMDEIDALGSDDKFGTTTVIPNDAFPSATADERVQVGSLLRDRFLLKEKVLGGSMGVIYKALDRRLAEAEADDPWVAIQILSPQLAENAPALRALQQEATKGRCLVHPNVVRFIDLDKDDDLYYLVMEWVEGRTLASVLDSADVQSIDRNEAFRIVTQIGDALEHAHRFGIVHADVKPGDIMLTPNGDAKLFEFGVARVRQKQSENELDPDTADTPTPAYSSMQVLTGEEPVVSDDVFSLACLLYRLIAGHRVFGPRNAAEAAQEGMTPQRPQGLADGQWRAIKKALSFARVARFASIAEFMVALRDTSDDPITADASERLATDEGRKTGRWAAAVILLFGLLGGAMYQYGLLDPWLDQLRTQFERPDAGQPVEPVPPPIDVPPIETSTEGVADDTAAETVSDAITEPPSEPEIVEPPEEPLIDFSTLPPADVEVSFAMGNVAAANSKVRLREDDGPVIVDFVRTSGVAVPLVLKLEEVGFSGNRSPWGSRQYSFSDSGIVRFPAGQDRSRITLTMASDPLREADQLSTLRLRELDSAESELAVIHVSLEDDDQRAFEAQLPTNTIAFASSQASIRETDPAVQIEIMRFNPDDSRLVVDYSVSDITATESEDYFAPSNYSITFGPGQRSARMLVPLVQDALVEGDEAFVIELSYSGSKLRSTSET
jgi:serine/threonine protein kinase